MDLLFQLANLLVLPFWLLMIFAPHWRGTKSILQSLLIVVPVSLIYVAMVVPALPALAPLLAAPRLDTIAAGLGTPTGAVTAWAHMTAFDLFVGRWMYLDSRERQISAWLSGPALFFTLMLGPLGLVLYLLLRRAYRRDL